MLRSINPYTEELIKEYPEHTDKQIEIFLSLAESMAAGWAMHSVEQRGEIIRRAGALLRERRAELAKTATLEMGKPIKDAEAEIDKCAGACEFFVDHAAEFLRPREIASDARRSSVRFDPLGPILAIMPWNFPYWQVFRFAAPALMAGNVAILKHAPNVSGCALAIEKIFAEAHVLPGAFNTVLVANDRAELLIRHTAIKAVTLTGSARAGRAVASLAGSLLKKTVLELGGSDPFIVLDDAVLEDADIDVLAKQAATARCINAGQSCIAAKRFIVVGDSRRLERFALAMSEAMSKLKLGDPLDRATDIGPLARLDLLENLQSQVSRSIEQGARLVSGGHRSAGRGYFYEPTVLANVRPGMPAFDEETFGPVAAVIQAADIDDAIALANQTPFGLGASIWTSDAGFGEKMATHIEAGCVFINGIVKSDSRLPFGGIKQSGYGRELSSFGIHEFVNIKTVWRK